MPTQVIAEAAQRTAPTVRHLLADPFVIALLARPLTFPPTHHQHNPAAPDAWMHGAQTADDWVALLDDLTRELTIFDTFEDLATDYGRIDEVGNGYVPTLRADLDPRAAILADAYDAYQAARGSAKRAFRG
jgi:hypothetical protein